MEPSKEDKDQAEGQTVDLDSSSSECDDDLRQLEELARLKAQLEAKVREKQRRKAAKAPLTLKDVDSISTHSQEQQSQETAASSSTQDHKAELLSPPIPKGVSNPSSQQQQQQQHQQDQLQESPAIGDPELSAHLPSSKTGTVTTTPPIAGTPLISPSFQKPYYDPGFRTPSPPHRARYDIMSPSSGAFTRSKKRQHSPSPLPQMAPTSAQKVRRPITIPATAPRRLFVGHADAKQDAEGKQSQEIQLQKQPIQPSTVNTKTAKAQLDEEDDFEDIDFPIDDNFDILSPSPKKPSTARRTSTISSIVSSAFIDEDNPFNPTEPAPPDVRRRQLADKARLMVTSIGSTNGTKPSTPVRGSSKTAAAAAETSLRVEDTDTSDAVIETDSLTGLRILSRVTPKEEIDQRTKNARVIPLKDTESIREKSSRPVLGSALTQGGEKKEDWIVAGVVGGKSKPRKSTHNQEHSLFRLCDLGGAIINLFMFKSVMDVHYAHLQVGDMIAVLSPDVLTQADRSGPVGVKVHKPESLLRIGRSKDFGLCEVVKMNNENCGLMVDKRASNYCTHHIMMVTDKQRNQRGSLIAGTSSIYDVDKKKPAAHIASSTMPIRIGRDQHQLTRRKNMDPVKETTYIFDDGGIASSSMTQPTKKPRTNGPTTALDDEMSKFLMSQNNPGAQYLRQAKTSRDVTLAKDITSPKGTNLANTELFPAEMVRRMGYDPVSGQFVPGSPKRGLDDPDARERSIRMLAERVKSPPSGGRTRNFLGIGAKALTPTKRKLDFGAMVGNTTNSETSTTVKPSKPKLSAGREVAGDVFFSEASPREASLGLSDKAKSESSEQSKRWVDLDDDFSSGSEAEMKSPSGSGSHIIGSSGSGGMKSPLPSLQEIRALNLRNARLAKQAASVASSERTTIAQPPKSEPKD
ncbi:hypothetical protein BGZ83_000761 [Gryganskiella cystojenkinii]|nr:hypothetical protein BGZ83_000761 [Gryganskiella cystojenkinii]